MNLILFKVSSLGDSLVFVSMAQALKDLCKVHVFTSEGNKELFQEILPHSQVYSFSKEEFRTAWKKPTSLLRLFRLVYQCQAQAVIMGDDQPNVAYLLAKLAGIPLRIGPKRSFVKIPRALTHSIDWIEGEPIPQWNWRIAVQFVEQQLHRKLPRTAPAPRLPGAGVSSNVLERPIVVHPGAGHAYQRWHADRFAAVATRLSQQHPVIWIDEPYTQELPMCIGENLKRMRPKSLRELTSLLSQSKLFLCNNSGPMHLAAAVACPSVILTGPSNPVWYPFWNAEQALVLRAAELPCISCDPPSTPIDECRNSASPMACMNYWSADVVYQKCLEWLEKTSSPGRKSSSC